MPKRTTEEICIDKINNGIQKILNKKIKPEDAKLSQAFEKLKDLNKPMYLDLMNDYKAALYGIPTSIG